MKSYSWLTPRDEKVYDYLKNHAKFVSTSQLTELFFKENENGIIKNSKIICRRRLAAIEKNIEEVKSFYRQRNTDKIYTITAKSDNIIPTSQIEHSLKLNDLYIQIKKYAKQNSHTIHNFIIEQSLSDKTIPDIILIYSINKRARIFLIEYDTGTETLTRIRKKIERYNLYFDRQLYLNENWQPTNIRPQLCFISCSEARIKRILGMGVMAYDNITKLLNY